MNHKLHLWHNTKLGYLIFTLIELALAYGFFSLSIDRGNLLWYLVTIIFLVGAFKNLFNFLGRILHGKH